MTYLNTNLKWEEFFIQESVELEEKMPTFELDAINKSKLRLSLENGILNWKKYEDWYSANLGCSSLKEDTNTDILANFKVNAKQAYEVYSNYDFWGDDLLPVFIWDNQVVIFGLQYHEQLSKIENHIFILAPPAILTFFANAVFNKEGDNVSSELDALESETVNKIEGLDLDIKAPTLDFKNISMETQTGVAPPQDPAVAHAPPTNESTVWDFITERQDEFNFEMKKNFSSFMVLKVDYDKTLVFKIDPELLAMNINESLFQYKLSDDNPFAKVYKTGVSESFSMTQLGMVISDFKYVCITALKHNGKVVGFLVGFKNTNLSENDQTLLEELAKECA